MELAIPIIALGGMYIIANQKNDKDKIKESFITKNNVKNNKQIYNPIPKNYPTINNEDLLDTDYKYADPNQASDKFFNQTNYQNMTNVATNSTNIVPDIYSLSGDYVASTEFRHNNMVPFYGAKMKGQMYSNESESILDNMMGAGSQVISKIEQAPLFKPENNIQWTNGSPNMTDFYQSRQNNALKNNMVKPFESIHVGPGINKGYGSEGSG